MFILLYSGLFTERTIPEEYRDACPGHRDYQPDYLEVAVEDTVQY